jgi:hypothetical protein
MEQFMHYVKEGSASRATSDVKFVCAGQPALRAAEGMFVGLGEKGMVKGFGIIESIGENITIKTGIQHFTTVWLSDVGLKDGIESRLS